MVLSEKDNPVERERERERERTKTGWSPEKDDLG
jgi:hypothetical protein